MEEDGERDLDTVPDDVDQEGGQSHQPAPASLRVVVLLQGPGSYQIYIFNKILVKLSC